MGKGVPGLVTLIPSRIGLTLVPRDAYLLHIDLTYHAFLICDWLIEGFVNCSEVHQSSMDAVQCSEHQIWQFFPVGCHMSDSSRAERCPTTTKPGRTVAVGLDYSHGRPTRVRSRSVFLFVVHSSWMHTDLTSCVQSLSPGLVFTTRRARKLHGYDPPVPVFSTSLVLN